MFVLPGQGQLNTVINVIRVEEMPGKVPTYGAKFVDPIRQTFRMLEAFISSRLR